jgi:uncharacterized protein YbjT (DUF2867 family)
MMSLKFNEAANHASTGGTMYAVTGATGNTGKIVAQRLLDAGKQVRAIGRDVKRLETLKAAGAETFVCDLTDAAALSRAFAGVKAAYVMIPPNMSAKDYRAFQDQVTAAVSSALAAARVEYAVTLSSYGADKDAKTGPVLGLHKMEQSINAIKDLNVLHQRASYFMENTFAQAGIIHAMQTAAGPVRPGLKIPMIATRDIGEAAAERLLHLDFEGKQARELLGRSDLTMIEVARIIGQAIGKPDLTYVQISDEQFRAAVLQMGLPADFVNLILEMVAAMNSGHMRALEARSPQNTTPTSYATFVTEEFVPLYKGQGAH